MLEARKAGGLTQTGLAELAHTSQGTVSRTESGEQMPAADVAARIAGVLGLTVPELLELEELPSKSVAA